MDDTTKAAITLINAALQKILEACTIMNHRIHDLEQQVAVLTPIQED